MIVTCCAPDAVMKVRLVATWHRSHGDKSSNGGQRNKGLSSGTEFAAGQVLHACTLLAFPCGELVIPDYPAEFTRQPIRMSDKCSAGDRGGGWGGGGGFTAGTAGECY